jgi:ribosomal protein S18 acetylase RimI-like enzyme
MSPHLSIVPAGSRERFIELLLLADESPQQVRHYIDSGDLYVYSLEQTTVGLILAIPVESGVVELKAVAVEGSQQAQGIGKQMLAAVLAHLQRCGCKRAIVGTASSGMAQLAYYQKAGFRMNRIERDFFTPARGYPESMIENGIRVRDMVWMDMRLDA